MRLRSAAALALSVLLATGGAVRAQQQEAESPAPEAQPQAAETLTPDERREAGEFLLRLDERWREARDFNALFDDAFVGDYVQIADANTADADDDALPFVSLDASLRGQLSAAELRRAHVAGLDLLYVFGRLFLTFEQWEQSRKAAGRKAAARRDSGEPPAGDAGDTQPSPGKDADASSDDDGDNGDDPSFEELLSPPVFEEFKRDPMLRAYLLEDGEGEASDIATHEQLNELLSALEHAARKTRARVRELEADLPGAPVSVVPREDDGEGESPDLSLTTLGDESKNRPAGTRIVCGYIGIMHVHLIKEGGRYKVLAAYLDAD